MSTMRRFLFLTVAIIISTCRLLAQTADSAAEPGLKNHGFTFRKISTGQLAYQPGRPWFTVYLPYFFGTANTVTGTQALNSCTSCYENAADGYQALYSCTTAYGNTAIGYQSLYSVTTSGANTAVGFQALNANTGVLNTALGAFSMDLNTTGANNTALGAATLSTGSGSNNTAVGYAALENSISESYSTAIGTNAMTASHAANGYNVAVGYDALYGSFIQGGNENGNSGGFNVAAGANALKNNTTGMYNVATGYDVLIANSSGNFNIVSGPLAAYANSSGEFLVGSGFAALYSNTTGAGNTAIGSEAMYNNTTGSNNTTLGFSAGTGSGALNNAMALGSGATVNASNQVVVGNTSVTSIGGYANWTNFSDGRFKRNIQQNVPGLAFINKLTPITYTLDVAGIEAKLHPTAFSLPAGATSTHGSPLEDPLMRQAMQEKSAVTYTGFVAQDVEKAADSVGFVFSGVDKPKDANQNFYGLRYADFVPTLVKAVQELSAASDKKDSAINALKGKFDSLQTQVNELKALLMASKSTASGATLEQNAPNPFSGSTVIGYTLPRNVGSAQLRISDGSGRVLAIIPLANVAGHNTLRADVSGYASGTYNYSLVIDGKLAGTKQMISAR
jgi:trimeric autotransporter adhesin